MSLISERYNGGTNGANLTQAAGNTSHTVISPNNAATLKFSNAKANPFTGGLIAVSTAGAGVTADMRHDRTAANQGSGWIAFRAPSAAPGATVHDILTIRGTRNNAGIRIHTGGTLRVLNLGNEIGGAAIYTNFLTDCAGQDIIVDLLDIEGTTAANGTIKARVRKLSDLTTNLYSYDSGATRDAGVIGTDTITSYRGGKITSTSTLPEDFWIYGIDANDGASVFAADPTFTSPPPAGTLPVRQLRHYYDFSAWTNRTSVTPSITSGPALAINTAGMVVNFTDVANRTSPVGVSFTVTGAGGNTVVTDTIPVGGTSATQLVEEVIAGTATNSPTDWLG
jgi:hypothetical protein